MNNMYVYVNVKGRIIEGVPVEIVEIKYEYYDCVMGYRAKFKEQLSAETRKNGMYCRELAPKPGTIKNNAIWLTERNLQKAKEIFLEDVTKRFEKINKRFNDILDEKERLEQS